jgi:hypothetical protein
MNRDSKETSLTPIEELKTPSTELVRRLKENLDIHTIEDLIAMYTAMNDDPETMASALGLEIDELEEIILEAREIIPEEVLKRLDKVPPVDDMPFGALPPEEDTTDK